MLDHIILVDTPDTNTTPENREKLLAILEVTDVILPVFHAQNPKIHDNISFLKPIISQFSTKAIAPILNSVDCVPLSELQGEILPDFRDHITQEWFLESPQLLAVSAKSALPDPKFPERGESSS